MLITRGVRSSSSPSQRKESSLNMLVKQPKLISSSKVRENTSISMLKNLSLALANESRVPVIQSPKSSNPCMNVTFQQNQFAQRLCLNPIPQPNIVSLQLTSVRDRITPSTDSAKVRPTYQDVRKKNNLTQSRRWNEKRRNLETNILEQGVIRKMLQQYYLQDQQDFQERRAANPIPKLILNNAEGISVVGGSKQLTVNLPSNPQVAGISSDEKLHSLDYFLRNPSNDQSSSQFIEGTNFDLINGANGFSRDSQKKYLLPFRSLRKKGQPAIPNIDLSIDLVESNELLRSQANTISFIKDQNSFSDLDVRSNSAIFSLTPKKKASAFYGKADSRIIDPESLEYQSEDLTQLRKQRKNISSSSDKTSRKILTQSPLTKNLKQKTQNNKIVSTEPSKSSEIDFQTKNDLSNSEMSMNRQPKGSTIHQTKKENRIAIEFPRNILFQAQKIMK